MTAHLMTDPYVVLGISYDSDDEKIRKAFQAALREKGGKPEIYEAYEMIRTKEKREHYRWDSLYSFIVTPPCYKQNEFKKLDIENLVKELAFLSPWELGSEG